MIRAAKDLNATLFTHMIHFTNLAHGVHRQADFIRGEYLKVDSLVSNVKKIFLKAPSCVQLLKQMYPDLSLPPESVITRWGTWLKAAKYYAHNWAKIKSVVEALHDDSVAIVKTKELLQDDELFAQVAFINRHYVFLADCITQLKAENKPMREFGSPRECARKN